MASKGSTLGTNEYLNVDDYLQSANGRYKAALQADGNFVLSRGNATLWQSGTGQGPGAYFALMQDDGNFAVYLGTPQQPGNWVWGSDSVRGPGNYVLALQDDGNLVLSQRVSIWNSAQPDQQAQPQPDQQAESRPDRTARAAGTTEEIITDEEEDDDDDDEVAEEVIGSLCNKMDLVAREIK